MRVEHASAFDFDRVVVSLKAAGARAESAGRREMEGTALDLGRARALQDSLSAIASVLEARPGDSLSARLAASHESVIASLTQREEKVARVHVDERAVVAGAAGPRDPIAGWAVGWSSAPAPCLPALNRSAPSQEIVDLVDSFKRQQRRVGTLVMGAVTGTLLLAVGGIATLLTVG